MYVVIIHNVTEFLHFIDVDRCPRFQALSFLKTLIKLGYHEVQTLHPLCFDIRKDCLQINFNVTHVFWLYLCYNSRLIMC